MTDGTIATIDVTDETTAEKPRGPFAGRTHTEESRQRISAGNKRSYAKKCAEGPILRLARLSVERDRAMAQVAAIDAEIRELRPEIERLAKIVGLKMD